MNVTEITAKSKEENKIIRLAAYCRVSSDSADQLHSFAAQIRYYKDYEQKHPEYKLVDIYADEGLTGTSMEKRDELNRLIRDCKKGKIDRIVVKSVSRFARNTQELLVCIRLLKELGISVYFEEQDHLMPTQIRIANLIARSPDHMEMTQRAERASIKDGQIVIEPIER